MDNSLKGLILAAGVVITCIVVGLGFYISREAKNTSSGGISQIAKMNSEYQDMSKTMYDGIKVSGREVLEVIEQYEGEIRDQAFSVTVKTGKNATGYTYTGASYSTEAAKNVKETNYINPDGNFLGEAVVDDNGVVVSIIFAQQ